MTPEQYMAEKNVWYGPQSKRPVRRAEPETAPPPAPVIAPVVRGRQVMALFGTATARLGFDLPEAKRPTAHQILARVSKRHGVGVKDIRGPIRMARIIAARHDAIREIHRLTDLSSVAIGRIVNKDHTTVLHVLRRTARQRNKETSQ